MLDRSRISSSSWYENHHRLSAPKDDEQVSSSAAWLLATKCRLLNPNTQSKPVLDRSRISSSSWYENHHRLSAPKDDKQVSSSAAWLLATKCRLLNPNTQSKPVPIRSIISSSSWYENYYRFSAPKSHKQVSSSAAWLLATKCRLLNPNTQSKPVLDRSRISSSSWYENHHRLSAPKDDKQVSSSAAWLLATKCRPLNPNTQSKPVLDRSRISSSSWYENRHRLSAPKDDKQVSSSAAWLLATKCRLLNPNTQSKPVLNRSRISSSSWYENHHRLSAPKDDKQVSSSAAWLLATKCRLLNPNTQSKPVLNRSRISSSSWYENHHGSQPRKMINKCHHQLHGSSQRSADCSTPTHKASRCSFAAESALVAGMRIITGSQPRKMTNKCHHQLHGSSQRSADHSTPTHKASRCSIAAESALVAGMRIVTGSQPRKMINKCHHQLHGSSQRSADHSTPTHKASRCSIAAESALVAGMRIITGSQPRKMINKCHHQLHGSSQRSADCSTPTHKASRCSIAAESALVAGMRIITGSQPRKMINKCHHQLHGSSQQSADSSTPTIKLLASYTATPQTLHLPISNTIFSLPGEALSRWVKNKR